MSSNVLILTRRDLMNLMTHSDYLVAVEEAFRAEKDGRAHSPLPMHIDGDGGAFHAKGASFQNDDFYVALKFNGNFPNNSAHFGLPTIQGAVFLCNGRNGELLSILDSIEITLMRTAAASALAAKHLARPDSQTLFICGCGDQGRVQAAALNNVVAFKKITFWDREMDKAKRLAKEIEVSLKVKTETARAFREGALQADVIAMCTTAQDPLLFKEDVKPGAFIAAVGADNPNKNEIGADLMAAAAIVTDSTKQCVEMGDLRAAVEKGTVSPGDVYAELGDRVTGKQPGRQSVNDIIVFDSTGTALQDVTSAAHAYRRAKEENIGAPMPLGLL